jgi:hypothetical protein
MMLRIAPAVLLLQLSLWGAQAVGGNPASPEQIMRLGAKLGAAQALEVEAELEANPEDLAARAKLLGYYYYQWMAPGEAASKAARRRHILWLIEHHPESAVTGLSEAAIDQDGTNMADEEGYRQARKLWLALLDSGKGSPAALGNLAKFFRITDKPLAERALLQARAAQPQNLDWDWQLGYLYGLGILGVDAMGLNGQPTSTDPLAQKGPFAAASRKALAESSSGTMLYVAATILWRYGTILTPSVADKLDYLDLAIQIIERAKAAEPANPSWPQFLLQLQATKRQMQAALNLVK